MFGRKILHIYVSSRGIISRRIRCISPRLPSCVWTAKLAASVFLVFPARPHLYFSTLADLYFFEGHICISPHRLIRISRLGCNGHKLAKTWISFPNWQRGLKTSALSPSLSLLFVITILMTAGICPCLHHDLKNFSSLPTYRSLPLSSS